MAIDYQASDTTQCLADTYRAVEGGAAGSLDVARSINSSSTEVVRRYSLDAIPTGSQDAGNMTVRINVTVANMNLSWVGLAIQRLNSACGGFTTLYDNSAAFSVSLGTTGVKEQTVSIAAVVAAAGDICRVSWYVQNTAMSGQSVSTRNDQIVTAPWSVIVASGAKPRTYVIRQAVNRATSL